MGSVRSNSSPELPPAACEPSRRNDSSFLEANVKFLPNVIQLHPRLDDDETRVASPSYRRPSMNPAADGIPGQVPSPRRRKAELRRCNTDLRRAQAAPGAREKSKLPPLLPLPEDLVSAIEEIEKLRRELSAALTARKSLERMFSCLGKEKQMIASELARKVHEVAGLEELVDDLRSQNETLSEKLLKAKKETGGNGGDASLLERNRILSEQLLKSLDSYKSTKRRYKESQDENAKLKTRAAEVAEEAAAVAQSLCNMRKRTAMAEGSSSEACAEMERIEGILVELQTKLCMKSSPKKHSKVAE